MEIYLKKLLFKASHRGTKEMDIILGNFAKTNLETMDIDNLKLFEELLELPDPDLYKWFSSEDSNIPKKFLNLVKEISN
ncbi:MAG: succinate dehydrogenase assembly factor 2 [Rhodobiaceae bacterium]|nr:succinate dehydrogenase assembly factor 2 [Rhodobiaceae bacterium]